ncbi:UTP--glucose-1-phosphate uridylyltransferase [Candidatus Fermentibacteria bacterium]|nr:UTP--glucose-1-phosphate uridylyltransferase [Candidatus Fermentibacteria bacterium]
MLDMPLTAQETERLTPFFFDHKLQERLCGQFAAGQLSLETNLIHGEITPPGPAMIRDIPDDQSPEGRAAHRAGASVVEGGRLALLILNGGMATRFGGGAKGIVSVEGKLSFLGLKVTAARLLSRRYGGEVPVYLMNSMATHEASIRHLSEHGHFGYDPALIRPFLQNTLLRITPDGMLFRHANGTISPYGPGHGDIVEAVARSVLSDMQARGIDVIQMSNVDNVLATPDPLLVGLHLLDGAEMTVEVVRNTGTDVGGGPLMVDGNFQIVEGFRLPPAFDFTALSDFNANTFYFSRACFHRHYDLSWFVVAKHVEGRQALQFERLAGQLSAFLPWSCRRVQRDGPGSRFSPIKDRPSLECDRMRISTTLRDRGFLSEVL